MVATMDQEEVFVSSQDAVALYTAVLNNWEEVFAFMSSHTLQMYKNTIHYSLKPIE